MENNIIFVRTKKTGNYMIFKKNHKNENTRMQFNLSNITFPFGKEEYNDNIVVNIQIIDSTNYLKNMMFDLLKIQHSFQNLCDNDDVGYYVKDKKFFDYIKLVKTLDDNTNIYHVRTYLKYGAKMNHAKFVGNLDPSFDIKGKKANATIEFGSLWINNDSNQYGVNVYLIAATIL